MTLSKDTGEGMTQNEDKVFRVSWRTWEGRKSEEVTYREFYERYPHLTESDGMIGSELKRLANRNPGSSFGWNEEEGMVTVKRIK